MLPGVRVRPVSELLEALDGFLVENDASAKQNEEFLTNVCPRSGRELQLAETISCTQITLELLCPLLSLLW